MGVDMISKHSEGDLDWHMLRYAASKRMPEGWLQHAMVNEKGRIASHVHQIDLVACTRVVSVCPACAAKSHEQPRLICQHGHDFQWAGESPIL